MTIEAGPIDDTPPNHQEPDEAPPSYEGVPTRVVPNARAGRVSDDPVGNSGP